MTAGEKQGRCGLRAWALAGQAMAVSTEFVVSNILCFISKQNVACHLSVMVGS